MTICFPPNLGLKLSYFIDSQSSWSPIWTWLGTHVYQKFRFIHFNFRYDVVVSSDVARTKTNGCIFFKLRDPSIDVLPSHYYSHKFVCVAPYNTDTLLLINIPKTMLEKVIKVGNEIFCNFENIKVKKSWNLKFVE